MRSVLLDYRCSRGVLKAAFVCTPTGARPANARCSVSRSSAIAALESLEIGGVGLVSYTFMAINSHKTYSYLGNPNSLLFQASCTDDYSASFNSISHCIRADILLIVIARDRDYLYSFLLASRILTANSN